MAGGKHSCFLSPATVSSTVAMFTLVVWFPTAPMFLSGAITVRSAHVPKLGIVALKVPITILAGGGADPPDSSL